MPRIGSDTMSMRTRAALATGTISLVGAFITGWLAFRTYADYVRTEDPEIDVVGAMFDFIAYLLAAALIAMVGFVVGSVVAMTLEWIVRRAPRMLTAVGLAFVLEVVTLPVAAFLVIWLDETPVASSLWLWMFIVVIGGVLPGFARWLTFRDGHDTVPNVAG